MTGVGAGGWWLEASCCRNPSTPAHQGPSSRSWSNGSVRIEASRRSSSSCTRRRNREPRTTTWRSRRPRGREAQRATRRRLWRAWPSRLRHCRPQFVPPAFRREHGIPSLDSSLSIFGLQGLNRADRRMGDDWSAAIRTQSAYRRPPARVRHGLANRKKRCGPAFCRTMLFVPPLD